MSSSASSSTLRPKTRPRLRHAIPTPALSSHVHHRCPVTSSPCKSQSTPHSHTHRRLSSSSAFLRATVALSAAVLVLSTLPIGVEARLPSRRAPEREEEAKAWRRDREDRWWERDTPSEGYYDPNDSGGSMLTSVPDTYPAGLGEPINVILSANSDSAILVDSSDDGGLQNYFQSIGFAGECLGQHSGSDQAANLGDGNGYLNETAVMRWDYGDPSLGTCTETIKGGNHFRYWQQDGSSADSGAYFLALSYELPISEQHDIIDNGYNLGRDWFVGNATAQSSLIPTSEVTSNSTYEGETSAEGWTYKTSVQYVSGLLPNTSDGINHYQSMTTNACDGLAAVLTVSISSRPQAATSDGLTAHALPLRTPMSLLLALFAFLLLA